MKISTHTIVIAAAAISSSLIFVAGQRKELELLGEAFHTELVAAETALENALEDASLDGRRTGVNS